MAIKMDKTSIIVCSVIGSLGLLSAILGFSAEGAKLTPYTILVVYDDQCYYPQNPAIGLGICAAIFLIVAQITFSAVGACCGCCRSRSFPSETKRIVGIVCAVFSWIAAVIAFALFIDGAALNANGVRVADPFCPYLKDGVFAGAGVLALAATALSITSFIMQRSQPAAGAGNAAAAAAAAPASAAATPAGGQSPSPEVVIGRPLLPPGKPHNDYPVKPQGYELQPQQVLPTTESLPQGYYAQPPQNLQPPPAAQNNNVVYYAPNHQLPPRPPAPAAAAAPAVVVAAAAATEPSVLQPALGAVAMGQPLPQVVPLPGVLPSAPSMAGSASSAGLSTVIRNEVARQGVKLAAQVVTQSLFSDSTVGDGVLSMVTASAGDDADAVQVQATN